MLVKFLPGITITVALALFFTLAPDDGFRHGTAHTRGASLPDAGSTGTRSSKYASEPGVTPTASENIQSVGLSFTEPFERQAMAVMEPPSHGQTGPIDPPSAAMTLPVATNIGTRERNAFPAKCTVSEAAADTATAFSGFSATAINGVASGSALASLGGGGPYPSSDPYGYLDMPDRGLRLSARGRFFDAKQEPMDYGLSNFKHKGGLYTLSFMKDWSVDSSFGMSVHILDSEVKSLHPADQIQNNLEGYLLSGDYSGAFMGKFPAHASIFYGRVENSADGRILDIGTGVATPTGWHEDRHRSTVYGFTGRIGLPLIYGDDFKFMPEIGIRYMKVKSKSYDVSIENAAAPFRQPGQDSSSLIVPLTTTLKRDFMQCWGLLTPKLNAGISREFEDSALAARAFNSSSASKIFYDAPTGTMATPVYEDSPGWFWEIGVGMEVRTVGGWEMSAEYKRVWADKYKNDIFSLELAKCF